MYLNVLHSTGADGLAIRVSFCQSAEWGMRALQASFPRLKDRLVFEKKWQKEENIEDDSVVV